MLHPIASGQARIRMLVYSSWEICLETLLRNAHKGWERALKPGL